MALKQNTFDYLSLCNPKAFHFKSNKHMVSINTNESFVKKIAYVPTLDSTQISNQYVNSCRGT